MQFYHLHIPATEIWINQYDRYRRSYYLRVEKHDQQDQFLDLGGLVKPTRLKWNQSKQESHK